IMRRDPASLDQQIHNPIDPLARVDDASVGDQKLGHVLIGERRGVSPTCIRGTTSGLRLDARLPSHFFLFLAAITSHSTAIRTARPLVTWSRITLWGPSATSGVISTPRLIGPGAMIRMSVLARANRSLVMA